MIDTSVGGLFPSPDPDRGGSQEPTPGADPDLPLAGSLLTIAFRRNGNYEKLTAIIQAELERRGADVRVVEVTEGREQDALKAQLDSVPEAFVGRLVLADSTVRKALNGTAPKGQLAYSLDTLISEQLREFVTERPGTGSIRRSLVGMPVDKSDAVARLQLFAGIFEDFVRRAVSVEKPDKVYVFPQYLMDHEPFLMNTSFLIGLALRGGRLDTEEQEALQQFHDKNLLDFYSAADKRGVPADVHNLITKGLGFRPLQPHDLIARSLARAGIEPERIEVVHQSRRALSAQDLAGGEKVWFLVDRHALSLGGERAQAFRGLLEELPNVAVLRLPLEMFLEDLAVNNLFPIEGKSPVQRIAEGCIEKLAKDLAGLN